MALGKNLKKRKLIAEKPETPKKASTKKTKAAKKDVELIEKPKAKKATKPKAAPKKKTAPKAKKKQAAVASGVEKKKAPVTPKVQEEKVQRVDTGLPIYIAKELHELKATLRTRYEDDVAKLKGHTIQFVIIEIGGESYAIDIDSVKEVVPLSNLSRTPNTPEHIQGIANVRGATYVVFDLTKKFKLEEVAKHNYLLVLEYESVSAALSLDALPTTRKINGDHISSELHMIENASLDVSYIKGLIRDDEQLIYYLDIIELLKNDKAIVVPDSLVEAKA